MNVQLEQPTLALQAGQVVTLDNAAGKCIEARLGTLWVTEEGAHEDYVVAPGECWVIARAGRTLVQAMQPAWVSITN